MENLIQDIRFGLRMLRKSPGFALIAVLSLAFGIGANTAIFTIINAVFLHPLPVQDPSTLVSLFTTDEKNKGGFNDYLGVSNPNFEDIRERNRSFSGIAAYNFIPIALANGKEPFQVGGEIASGNFFDVIGLKPFMGRTFLPDEDAKSSEGSHPVVVMSYALWANKFGSDPNIVGKQVTLNGQGFTIIGVMPKGFVGLNPLGGTQLWVPMAMHNELVAPGFIKDNWNDRRFLLLNGIVARLKPGVNQVQAVQDLASIGRQLQHEYPIPNRERSFTSLPLLQSNINPGFRNILVAAGGMLMAVVGLVLLIACANIANLMLARATGRRREVSIRLALGAGRGRLINQLLTESLMLALLGAGVGLLVAMGLRDLLWNLRPGFLAQLNIDLSLDARVLSFTVLIAVLTGLIFGLAPALQLTKPNLVTELKERTSSTGAGGRHFSLRSAFVVAELALSMITLVGAGLFLLSLRNAQKIDPGFESKNLGMITYDLGSIGYDKARVVQFNRQLLDRMQSVPGVQSATISDSVPLFAGGFSRTVFPEGRDQSAKNSGVLVQIFAIGDNYFSTMGIPLLRGSQFDSTVREDTRKVVIVNETMAKKFWPGEEAVGKRFKFFGDTDLTEIIGVAKDSKYNTIGEEPTPIIYRPLLQEFSPAVNLLFRTSGDPKAVLPSVRAVVQSMDRQLPLQNVYGIGEVIDQALWGARMSAGFLAGFAGLALLLAAIGIYGVMSYTVTQRSREIGIRMALGAQPLQVLQMILRQGAGLVLVGLVFGIGIAILVTRWIATLLYGVQPSDPLTFVVIAVLLTAVAMLASYLPARRAMKVDPVVALRYE